MPVVIGAVNGKAELAPEDNGSRGISKPLVSDWISSIALASGVDVPDSLILTFCPCKKEYEVSCSTDRTVKIIRSLIFNLFIAENNYIYLSIVFLVILCFGD
jgi:hypothetical protein